MRSSQKLNLCQALLLFFLPILTYAQTIEDSKKQSLPLNEIAVQRDASQSGELIVTPYPLDTASRAENNYRSAITFVQRGQLIAAQAQLQQALLQQKDHLPARELLVTLLLKQHAIQEAIAVLTSGIAITPTHSKFPLWLSQLHIKLNAPEHALHVLEQNLTRFEQQPEYLGALANLYLQNDRLNEAHQYFSQAARLAPLDGRWQIGIGMAAEALEDWSGAHGAYRRVQEYSFVDGILLQFAQQRLTIISAQFQ